MLLIPGSRATLTEVRLAPSSQTRTGTVTVSAVPLSRVTTRRTGIGAFPRLATTTSTESEPVITVSIAWSSFQVS